MDDKYKLRYHCGDKVRVREWGDMAEEFGTAGYMGCDGNRAEKILTPTLRFIEGMKLMCGKVVTISADNYFDGSCYHIKEDDSKYGWTDDMFEPISDVSPEITDTPELLDFLTSLPVQITKGGGTQK